MQLTEVVAPYATITALISSFVPGNLRIGEQQRGSSQLSFPKTVSREIPWLHIDNGPLVSCPR